MKIRYIFIFLIVFNLIHKANSQPCKDYHKRSLCYKAAYVEGFNYYGQSASALIEKNVTIKYNAVFYREKDYLVYLCTRPEFEPIHFTIYDSDTGELIYDNEEDNYINQVAFSMEYTRSLTIELTPIAEGINDDSPYNARTCLGVLILWKKMPKIGF